MPKGEDITTKFKVDISDLKKGVTEANRNIKLANAEFKAASAGMDDWTKSSEGLSAKLKQLTSILANENAKLKSYKSQLEAVEKSSQENGKRADELKRKLQELSANGVAKTSAEYKKYEKALNDTEKEQIANQNAADKLRITILNQQATIGRTEKEIRNYSTALDNLESDTKQVDKVTGNLSKELINTEGASKKASDGFTVMKGALASLVADGIRKAIDATKEFAKSMITTAAEVKAQNSQFEQTFGEMGAQAEAAIKRVADSTGILESRLKVTGAQIYAFARSNSATIPEAMQLMETALLASADSAAYYDKSLEESSETLKSFLKGNYANDAALGVSATEFTRNAKATELFGKKYNDLTEIQKQQTLLKMVTDSQKVSGAMGQASREADGWENVQGNLNETWRQFKAQVGTPFLEALIPVIQQITQSFTEWRDSVDWDAFGEKVKTAIDKIIAVFSWIIDNKDIIVGSLVAITTAFAVGKILSFITTISQVISIMKGASVTLETSAKAIAIANNLQTLSFIKTNAAMLLSKAGMLAHATASGIATAATWALNGALAVLTSPITLVVAAIAALIAIVVLLVKNWDKVKEAGGKAWSWIKDKWSEASAWFGDNVVKPVSEGFKNMWDGMKKKGSETWSNIKTTFSNVGKWFGDKFTSAYNAIKEAFAKIPTFFKNLWSEIQNTFSGLGTKIGNAISGAVKNAINGVISFIENRINSGIKLINGAIGIINKLPGVNVGKMSLLNLPRLYQGGILKKGQTGLLEGNGAEAVVPLDRNKYWIKKVTEELMRQLKLDSVFGRMKASAMKLNAGLVANKHHMFDKLNGATSQSNVNNFTQIINAPKQPSRIELYRQTRNLLDYKGRV